MRLTKTLKSDIIAHAFDCHPAECCGVIVNNKYIACTNTATDNEQFTLDPKDFARAEGMGEIKRLIHSHPDGGVLPSDLDKLQIELHGVPWVIVAVSNKIMPMNRALACMSRAGINRHFWAKLHSWRARLLCHCA